MLQRINLCHLRALGFVLVLLAPMALKAAEPEDIIKYRQNIMKAIGGHTAAAGSIIEGKVDYKPQLAGHAQALQALTRDIPGLFPTGSDFGDTRAKDEVWSKRAEFEKRAMDARNSIDIFAKALQGGNQQKIGASFKEVGESCKGCHKDFRQKED